MKIPMKKQITINNFDKDTNFASITVNLQVYNLQSIYAAGYVFLDKAYILLNHGKDKNVEVHIFSKSGTELKKLALDFCNELINYAHYFSRVENNSSAIKAIMQRVLFSVNPKFAEEAEEQEIQDLLKELEKEGSGKAKK